MPSKPPLRTNADLHTSRIPTHRTLHASPANPVLPCPPRDERTNPHTLALAGENIDAIEVAAKVLILSSERVQLPAMRAKAAPSGSLWPPARHTVVVGCKGGAIQSVSARAGSPYNGLSCIFAPFPARTTPRAHKPRDAREHAPAAAP